MNGYVSKDRLIEVFNKAIQQAQNKYRASGMPPEAQETIRWIEGAIKSFDDVTSTYYADWYLEQKLMPGEKHKKVLEWAIKQVTK